MIKLYDREVWRPSPASLRSSAQSDITDLLGHPEVALQQFVHGAMHEPLPVNPELAAWIEQPVYDQQP